MADQLGRSVGDMYEGAFIPGILLAGLYALYVFIVTVLYPKASPGLPAEAVGFREPNGSRGLTSLAYCSCGRIRLADDAEFTSRGADFVVLSMFFGIMFAFGIAVINWLANRF